MNLKPIGLIVILLAVDVLVLLRAVMTVLWCSDQNPLPAFAMLVT